MTTPGKPSARSTGRVALVTGAGGGIGRAVVFELLAQDWTVAATDLDPILLQAVPGPPAKAEGACLHRLEMDVCERRQVQRTADTVAEKCGGLDVLIQCAGIFHKTPLSAMDDSQVRQMIDVNLIGALTCMSVCVPLLRARRSGRIVNIASTAGLAGMAISPAYAASKAGLIAATRSAARELAPLGISVNAVAPSYCDTPMLARDKALIQAFAVPAIPMKRIAQPEEVAEVVLFLAMCRTPYLTGNVITLDGGLHVA